MYFSDNPSDRYYERMMVGIPTRHVDRIYMFEDGHVIESGSHDELMKANGKYAEMFNVQAKYYNE